MTQHTHLHRARPSQQSAPAWTISAVLPAYNEEAAIESAVLDLADHLSALVGDHRFEIIVVNDGSRDRTAAVLSDLQRRAPELPLVVVSHYANLGYGAA
jgi:glycosyltransferase involved in cell wall biosynthesis